MPAKKDCRLTKSDISRFASEARRKYFTSNNPIIGINNILSLLNGTVKTTRSEGGETLHIKDDGSFVITIPETTSSVRDAFTIAHELGHYFLHTNLENPGEVAFNRKGSNLEETQANWFAASFLMPEDEFREAASKFNYDQRNIAAHFGVSGAAAGVRMSVLGLVQQQACKG